MMMQTTAGERAAIREYFEGQEPSKAWAECSRSDWMLCYLYNRVDELTFRKLAWRLALETRVNGATCTSALMSPEAKSRMFGLFDYLVDKSVSLDKLWGMSWTKGHFLSEQENAAQCNANLAAAWVLAGGGFESAFGVADFACRAAGKLAALRGFEYNRAYNDARQDQADLIREMVPVLPE